MTDTEFERLEDHMKYFADSADGMLHKVADVMRVVQKNNDDCFVMLAEVVVGLNLLIDSTHDCLSDMEFDKD